MNTQPDGELNEPQDEFVSIDTLGQEEEVTTADATTEVVEDSPNDNDLPEKYHGKSLEEVVKMHQEAEKLASRNGQELGELRKTADDFIKRQLETPITTETPTQKQVSFDDVVKDPAKAVSDIVRDDITKINERLEQRDREERAMKFYDQHPEAKDILSNPEFTTWVQESPMRMRLLEQGNAYDFDAASDLMEMYGASHPAKTEADTEALDKKAKAHSTSKSNAGSGSGSRKVYRRADIVRLMEEDPERYQELVPEIRKAYAEKRVK